MIVFFHQNRSLKGKCLLYTLSQRIIKITNKKSHGRNDKRIKGNRQVA